uniref:Uncharacterized protein n=1 Tax=Parascaris univalens TaxID=6257 RepID=A0A915AHP6_PARUN
MRLLELSGGGGIRPIIAMLPLGIVFEAGSEDAVSSAFLGTSMLRAPLSLVFDFLSLAESPLRGAFTSTAL